MQDGQAEQQPVGEADIRWDRVGDEAPWPDYEQPEPEEWDVSARAQLVCDVPWLHPDVPAFAAEGGMSVVLCPFCGEQHVHHGYGHRLAHCSEPTGKGYVLRHAGPASPSMLGGAGAGGHSSPYESGRP
jgi:hypothetical protein